MENQTSTTKVCSRCKRELPISNFAKNKNCKDGHIGQCKYCKNELAKERKLNRKNATTPPVYPRDLELADKSPRELQEGLRKLKYELIARGFNCDVKLTYLQEIII